MINKEQGSRTAAKSKLVFFTSRILRLFMINKHGALGPAQEVGERKGPMGATALETIKTFKVKLVNTQVS